MDNAVVLPDLAPPQRRTTTFFDLPAEIHNHIYDTIHHTKAQPLATNNKRDPWDKNNDHTPALAQVNRQLRAECLPRHYRPSHMNVSFGHNVNASERKATKEWWKAFGWSRIPLICRFSMRSGRDIVVSLPGAPHHVGDRVTVRLAMSSYAVMSDVKEWNEKYKERIEMFVQGLVREKDGIKFLTADGIWHPDRFLRGLPPSGSLRGIGAIS